MSKSMGRFLVLLFLFAIFMAISADSTTEVPPNNITCSVGFVLDTGERTLTYPSKELPTKQCDRCFSAKYTTESGHLFHHFDCFGRETIWCRSLFEQKSRMVFNGCALCNLEQCNKPNGTHPLQKLIKDEICRLEFFQLNFVNISNDVTNEQKAFCSNGLDELRWMASDARITKLTGKLNNLTQQLDALKDGLGANGAEQPAKAQTVPQWSKCMPGSAAAKMAVADGPQRTILLAVAAVFVTFWL